MRQYALFTTVLLVGGSWDNGEAETRELVGEFEAIAGSDCLPAVSGGVFRPLPCRVEYIVSGDEIL